MVATLEIETIVIIGSGLMGHGIAQVIFAYLRI
jgi:3-hydroxyacyl-CoA dehydrogenase